MKALILASRRNIFPWAVRCNEKHIIDTPSHPFLYYLKTWIIFGTFLPSDVASHEKYALWTE